MNGEFDQYLWQSTPEQRRHMNQAQVYYLVGEMCDRCETVTWLIGFDSSEGEYGSVALCLGCLKELIAEVEQMQEAG